MGVLLFRCIVGFVAGAVGWVLVEPTRPRVVAFSDPSWLMFELRLTLALGVLIGAAVGGLSGYLQGSRSHFLKGLLFGALFGAIGMSLGRGLGGVLSAPFQNTQGTPAAFVFRMMAFMPMGAALGAGIGASTFNLRRAAQGAIGGLLAGAVAGFVFDPLSKTLADLLGGQEEIGGPGRALYACLLGGMIALLIGLVERAARSAWLRLELGRNEGREWSLDAAVNTIGRSEQATVPLFGDMNIAPQHAAIQKQGDQWVLFDAGSSLGTGLNGQRISQAVLSPGSVIQIGGYQLIFLVKGFAAPKRAVDGRITSGSITPGSVTSGPIPPSQSVSMGSPNSMPYASQAPAPVLDPTVVQPAFSAVSYRLTIMDGPLAGQQVQLPANAELGREGGLVPLAFDHAVSRRHASLSIDATGVHLNDLGSTNGTFVAGQRVSTALLRPGDSFRIGTTTFRIDA